MIDALEKAYNYSQHIFCNLFSSNIKIDVVH